MTHLVLVLNAGSSSLKYRLVDPRSGEAVLGGLVERVGGAEVPDHAAALDVMQHALSAHDVDASALQAVGHRVVHGGRHLVGPMLLDDDTVAAVEEASHLAPLHNPPALVGIRSAREQFPDTPQVAVFDTDFFVDLPAAAATYAIDATLAEREDVRRYGAHGISHEYVASAAAAHLGRDVADLDQITLHLGNGASASAITGGRPADTSMGLTPLAGLVMGTRPGDLDPGAVLHLLRHGHLGTDDLEDLLHHHSGLRGLCGHTDVRDLMAAVDAGDQRARTAYDVYCHRLRCYVGAYLAVLGGADVISFTAGVGEHEPRVREDALRGLQRLGIEIDPRRNRAGVTGARRISTDDSPVVVLVVPTDEELAIARKARALLDP